MGGPSGWQAKSVRDNALFDNDRDARQAILSRYSREVFPKDRPHSAASVHPQAVPLTTSSALPARPSSALQGVHVPPPWPVQLAMKGADGWSYAATGAVRNPNSPSAFDSHRTPRTPTSPATAISFADGPPSPAVDVGTPPEDEHAAADSAAQMESDKRALVTSARVLSDELKMGPWSGDAPVGE